MKRIFLDNIKNEQIRKKIEEEKRLKEEKLNEQTFIDNLKIKLLKNTNLKIQEKITSEKITTEKITTEKITSEKITTEKIIFYGKTRENNPEFTFKTFNDNEKNQFIRDNFTDIVLETYDNLPNKIELWSYCILYIEGGIYCDDNLKPVNDFKFINLTDKNYFLLDFNNEYFFSNKLMISKSNNIIFLHLINKIIEKEISLDIKLYKSPYNLEKINNEIFFNENLILKDLSQVLINSEKFSFIEKVVYINLSKRNDRKEHMKNILSIFPQEKIVRFNAIENKKGAIGCSQSHIGVIKMAIKKKWENCLVLEDDAIWNRFEEGYNLFNNLFKKDFDVIVLGGYLPVYDKKTYKLESCSCAGAYFVKKHYYKTLLDNFEEGLSKFYLEHYGNAVDVYWIHLMKKDNWYIVYPQLFLQKDDYSDIVKCNVSKSEWVENIEKKT